MRLEGALTEAASGLAALARQLATVSQNVANAGTAGYARETLAVASVAAEGEGMGVRSGVATRSVDAALQADLQGVDGQVAGETLRSSVLAGVDAASGAPGSGQDLSSLVGAVRDGFSTLETDPADGTQQQAVVTAAANLAQGVAAMGQALDTARQGVQDGLVSDVAAANTALGTIGALTRQIVAGREAGQGTADLEDKRDAAMDTVATLTGARFLSQANGGVLAVSGGVVLPLRDGALGMAAAAVGAGTGAPGLTVDGAAVAGGANGVGGRIGAGLQLRDTELPGLQAGLDGFAQSLAAGFQGAGLTLFTDGSGAVPAAATAGFAQTIRVNPAVAAAPNLVRDGTAGTGTGAAGDTSVIGGVLSGVLATGTGTVSGAATDLVAHQASLATAAAAALATGQAVQTSLGTKLQAGSGVSVDTEMATMVQLQNSYGANAKVIAAVQSMWTQLLGSVQ